MAKGSTIIVGLSGGADSVCLMDLLYKSGYKIIAAHVNFHLRGQESNRDETFVRRLCRDRYPDARLVVRSFDTIGYAREQGLSVEMAARVLRYDWFAELKVDYEAGAIAVAHHAGDQVETLLLNLARGTGGRGLCGMRSYDERTSVWRPLLSVTRDEILQYLSEQQLPPVEDSTNEDPSITRNLIRHKLIPLFREINPSFTSSTINTMSHLREEQEYLDRQVAQAKLALWNNDCGCLDLDGDPFALYRIMSEMDLTATQIDDILSPTTEGGALFVTVTGDRYEFFRKKLYRIVLPAVSTQPAGTEMVWSQLLTISFHQSPCEGACIRAARPTDTFVLQGMSRGHKSVFQFLKECGIPSSYRPLCPVLVDRSGRVQLVLCRHRGAQPFQLTPVAGAGYLAHLLCRGV